MSFQCIFFFAVLPLLAYYFHGNPLKELKFFKYIIRIVVFSVRTSENRILLISTQLSRFVTEDICTQVISSCDPSVIDLIAHFYEVVRNWLQQSMKIFIKYKKNYKILTIPRNRRICLETFLIARTLLKTLTPNMYVCEWQSY